MKTNQYYKLFLCSPGSDSLRIFTTRVSPEVVEFDPVTGDDSNQAIQIDNKVKFNVPVKVRRGHYFLSVDMYNSIIEGKDTQIAQPVKFVGAHHQTSVDGNWGISNTLIAVCFIALVAAGVWQSSKPRSTGVVPGARITVDRQTGCQYLIRERAITARLGADGKPLCGNT